MKGSLMEHNVTSLSISQQLVDAKFAANPTFCWLNGKVYPVSPMVWLQGAIPAYTAQELADALPTHLKHPDGYANLELTFDRTAGWMGNYENAKGKQSYPTVWSSTMADALALLWLEINNG
jgi:hypothetical protein